MVVCQYFLEGRCHFGQNCRNEHIYNNNTGGRGNRNSGNNQLNNVVWQISNEVTAAEKGGQWPLTCFAPIKEGPCLPGWKDISPEEVRWTLYEAQRNGTVNQALNQISQWYKDAERARNTIKEPTREMTNLISDILKGKKLAQSHTTANSGFTTCTSTPSSGFRFDTAISNIFGNSTGHTPSSGSIFAGSNSTGFQNQNQNVFGSPTQGSSNNISGIFSTSQQTNQNVFTSSANIGQNIFSTDANTSVNQFFRNNIQNVFQMQTTPNVFSNATSTFNSSSPFVEKPSIFGNAQSNPFQQQNNNSLQQFGTSPFKPEVTSVANMTPNIGEIDSPIYSKMEDLSESEIKSYTSTTFTFGNIPLKPPPQQYC